MIGFHIRTIAFKECLDGLRDRRALFSALLFPIFGPVLVGYMFATLASPEEIEEGVKLPVIGAEHAPNLMAHLSAMDIEITAAPEDPQQAVATGSEELILRIGEDYPLRFKESRPAKVEMILDESRIASKRKSNRVRAALDAYKGKVGAMRLLARGISPQVVQVISVQGRNLATPQTKGANLFEMVVMFAVMAAFLCNMYIAIDATAGERERGSMEPLLINPVSRTALVLGKWVAAIVFGLVGVALTLACTAIVMKNVPLEHLGMRFVFGVREVWFVFFCFMPLVLLAGALQLFLSSFARTFKEAQTYLSLVMFLPMLPGMWLMFKPTSPDLWMASVPALGQQVLAGSVLRGESLGWGFIGISMAMSTLLSIVFLWMTVRLFKSERFFFKS